LRGLQDDWKVGVNGVTQAQVQENYDNLFAKASNGSFATAGTIMCVATIPLRAPG
jgi:hypothetical protein